MKTANSRLCIFEFNNGTFIRTIVPLKYPEYSFIEYFEIAKEISWNGDENSGRGNLKSFTVGDYVRCSE